MLSHLKCDFFLNILAVLFDTEMIVLVTFVEQTFLLFNETRAQIVVS